MASLTNCEFMVKGYHYTKPTIPVRTDSCRLYLDTKVDSYETQTISREQMRTETLPYNISFTYILKNQPKIGTTINFTYDTSGGPGDFNIIAGIAISQNDIYDAISLSACVSRRTTKGAPGSVGEELELIRKWFIEEE